jgi:predicted AlkP superfamily pyrophosphatase or phosphodiesterase
MVLCAEARSYIVVPLLTALLTACATDAPEPESQKEPVKKVLLIGLDGIRTDILAQADTPNIDALVANGAFSDRAVTRPPTVSGPGWSSMLVGVWADKHGVLGNDFTENNYDQYPDFLTRIEQVEPELQTFAVVDWLPLGGDDSGGPLISDSVDTVVAMDGYDGGFAAADAKSLEVAVQHLTTQDPDAAFVYFGNTDEIGHEFDSLAPEYRAEIETADRYVGDLVAAIQNRPTYASEDWLILMSTDHGRRDDGGHGGESELEKRIFFLANGPSIIRAELAAPPEIVDVAATAMTHLGIDLDPAWKLDGQPLLTYKN